MARKHGARQQKRLAKQKAKRADRRKQLARSTSNNPAIRFLSAAAWPIVATLEPESLWEKGIGNMVIARRAPGGRIVAGVFLLDVYCLGVKDAFWRELGEAEYKSLVVEMAEKVGPFRDVSPERFSKLVHCAADYAQSFGLPPHPDFRNTRHLMDGIDPSLCHDEFEFGRNGRPYYIAGPNDSYQRMRMVVDCMNAIGGHYIIPASPPMTSEVVYLDEE